MTRFRPLAIPDVLEVQPPRFEDARGYFSEVYKRAEFEAQGLRIDWMQDNHSYSALAGTVRALHFQAPPVAQAKLVRAVRGAIFDVAVDLRIGSSTYGRWVACELSAEQGNQMFVPAGFAHGFMTLLDDTDVLYKVDAPYSAAHEQAIAWNDPDIGIEWPRSPGEVVLSDRDRAASGFAALKSPFDQLG